MRQVDHGLLNKAKKNKNDEFYTQLKDIEAELDNYIHHFKDSVVYCNCDDPQISNFVKYFLDNFEKLGLKKLIASSYEENGRGKLLKYSGGENKQTVFLNGEGDFRGDECRTLLREADIVVTNPPFSLFRDFIDLMNFEQKKFLAIGNINAITYRNVFKLIQAEKIWLGVHLGRGISGFIVPKHYELYGTEARISENGDRIIAPNNCLWMTNLDYARRHQSIELTQKYEGNEDSYPTYDNLNGININKTKDIPSDYMGYMGVPITFLHKHNPEQFEIIRFRKGDDGKDLAINGKCPYFRIVIRRRSAVDEVPPLVLNGQETLW